MLALLSAGRGFHILRCLLRLLTRGTFPLLGENHDLFQQLALPEDAYPQDGFFYEYMEHASPLTDGPDEFFFGPALVSVGGTIGNKMSIPFGSQSPYPNLWLGEEDSNLRCEIQSLVAYH